MRVRVRASVHLSLFGLGLRDIYHTGCEKKKFSSGIVYKRFQIYTIPDIFSSDI